MPNKKRIQVWLDRINSGKPFTIGALQVSPNPKPNLSQFVATHTISLSSDRPLPLTAQSAICAILCYELSPSVEHWEGSPYNSTFWTEKVEEARDFMVTADSLGATYDMEARQWPHAPRTRYTFTNLQGGHVWTEGFRPTSQG